MPVAERPTKKRTTQTRAPGQPKRPRKNVQGSPPLDSALEPEATTRDEGTLGGPRVVSARDYHLILEHLAKPRKPNAALQAAFIKYKNQVSN